MNKGRKGPKIIIIRSRGSEKKEEEKNDNLDF